MENVLHQRRSDFRNAERDRDEYSDGGCDHVFVDPATTRVSDLGSATKEYNKLYVEDAALTGILTVTGTTTVSDVVKPSTNQLIDLWADKSVAQFLRSGRYVIRWPHSGWWITC
jgi:hypothetical protein